MRTICTIATAAMLAAGGMSQALAQEAQQDAHHPAATTNSGGAMGGTTPDAKAAPPMPGPGCMMSPEMARMMPMMMKTMCAMMQGEAGEGMMAGPRGAGMATADPTDPVTGAFEAINRRMHEGMVVDASGGADRAFVVAMIAHHQGAVDMAKVILAFGSDPKIHTLAEQVIKAQEGEIALMQQWLKDHPAG